MRLRGGMLVDLRDYREQRVGVVTRERTRSSVDIYNAGTLLVSYDGCRTVELGVVLVIFGKMKLPIL